MELQLSINKLQHGDDKELKRLYSFYFPHFLSFAHKFVQNEDVARDIVQEVFIAYWVKHREFSDLVSLKVYFYRSIRNRCLNELRSSTSHEHVGMEEAKEVFSASWMEEQVIREEVAVMVRQEISRLSPQAQKVLLLSLQGKSNQEIADLLSLSINTVKTHKQKAYAQLRLRLREIRLLLNILALG